jgi:hypothetical protein
VRAGAVPVAGDRLRVQGQHNSCNLCDPLQSINSASNQSQSVAMLHCTSVILTENRIYSKDTDLEDVAGHPQLVGGGDPDGRANLELPLSHAESGSQSE